MQNKNMNNIGTPRSHISPLATLLFSLGAAAALAAVAPALAETKGGQTSAGEPTTHQPSNETDGGATPAGDPTTHRPIDVADEPEPSEPCVVRFKSEDCNGNGVHDACDIADGWADADENGVLDACQLTSGDLDISGSVDIHDIVIVLSDWGTLADDVNGDGIVDGQDLAIILSNLSSKA